MKIDEIFGKQVEGFSEDEILNLIEKATTKKQLDVLRMNCVKFLNTPRGKEILVKWQTKYRTLTICQSCGHRL